VSVPKREYRHGFVAETYDLVYSSKDYRGEARKVVRILRSRLGRGRKGLLDVCCGTGEHLRYLKRSFRVEGLDGSRAMLRIARKKLPDVSFHSGDMMSFDLGREYDAVINLFSSIGYARSIRNLNRAIRCMARHLRPGGVLLVEPWVTPTAWRGRSAHLDVVEQPEIKIARASTSRRRGRLSWFDMHHLVATSKQTTHFVERHVLGLFTRGEMKQAFRKAGFGVEYDPEGLFGRGLYIGTKSGDGRRRQ